MARTTAESPPPGSRRIRGRCAGSPAHRPLRRAASRAAAGLTLLEVMVASALLAVFFSVVFAIVFSTLHTRDEIERKAIPWSIGPVVLQRISDDLRFAEFESIAEDEDAFKAEAPRDDEVRLDFVTSVPSRDKVQVKDEWVRAAVNEVGFRLRRSEADSSLFALYRREDLGVDADPSEGGRYYKLCDRVRSFKVDWFDEDPDDPNGDDAAGVPDWDGQKEKKMPWGCRVTLVLAGWTVEDDRGAEVETGQDHVFQTFVVFRTRHDKPESAAKPPGTTPGR